MLGNILDRLTDPATAEATLSNISQPALRDRIVSLAVADSCLVGVLIADKVRHLLDHGGEEIWLDLLGAMSGSAQPGVVAIDRIMALAFPDPVRVRITRSAG